MAAPELSDTSNRSHIIVRVRSNLAGFARLHLWPVERTESSQMLKLHRRCMFLHVKWKSMADRNDFCSKFLGSSYECILNQIEYILITFLILGPH